MSTFETLSNFNGGKRIISKYVGVDILCDRLDDLKPADVTTIMMLVSARRAAEASTTDIIEGSHFSAPSPLDPRKLHAAQGCIYNVLDGVDFIDLSPLQPEGTSHKLAGTNQKNIMPALRRNEVNSDATTSLFREAYSRSSKSNHNVGVRLATNARITRVQQFDPKTGFLPHFSMFAQVSIGEEKKYREDDTSTELSTLAAHLASEIAILDAIALNSGNIKSIDVQVGNILLTEDIISRFNIDRQEVRRRTQDPDFDLLELASGIEIPDHLSLSSASIVDDLRQAGLTKGLGMFKKFKNHLELTAPNLLERVRLDLGRVAGIGYYNNLCYKIHAVNHDGLTLPLVDGGTTDWMQKVDPRNKRHFTVGSGIGTELLALHYM